MVTSTPLLTTSCCILIIYSFDLIPLRTNTHGYYTLLSTWCSFIILSILVAYDNILYLSSSSNSSIINNSSRESSGSNDEDSSSSNTNEDDKAFCVAKGRYKKKEMM
jgi:hypothetical protein